MKAFAVAFVVIAALALAEATPTVSFTKGSDGSAAHQFKNPCKVVVTADPGVRADKRFFIEPRSYVFYAQALPALGWMAVQAEYSDSSGQTVIIPLTDSAEAQAFEVPIDLSQAIFGNRLLFRVLFATRRMHYGGTNPEYSEYVSIYGEVVPDLSILDMDNNGLKDVWEIEHFGNVGNDPNGDDDRDGLNNLGEIGSGTDPNMPDSDWDGVSDSAELADGTIPTDPDSVVQKRIAYFPFDSVDMRSFERQAPRPLAQGFFAPEQRIGLIGRALRIDQNGQLSVFNWCRDDGSPNYAFKRGSVRMWFKPDWGVGGTNSVPNSWARLFDLGIYSDGGATAESVLHFAYSDPVIHFTESDGNGHPLYAAFSYASQPVVANKWHQLVVTYSPTTRKIYLDGSLLGEQTGTWDHEPNVADFELHGLKFGSDGYQPIKGLIDEAEFYNYELDAEQIAEAYVAQVALDTDGNGILDKWEDYYFPDGLPALEDSWWSDDDDLDGLLNSEEAAFGSDPANPSSGGSGIKDGWLVNNGYDPLTATGDEDEDENIGDGLTLSEEYEAGTDPQDRDFDDDGVIDGSDAVPTDWAIRWERTPETDYAIITLSNSADDDELVPIAIGNNGEILANRTGSDPVLKLWKNGQWIELKDTLPVNDTSGSESISSIEVVESDIFNPIITDDGSVIVSGIEDSLAIPGGLRFVAKWSPPYSGNPTSLIATPTSRYTWSSSSSRSEDGTVYGVANRRGQLVSAHWTSLITTTNSSHTYNINSDRENHFMLPDGTQIPYSDHYDASYLYGELVSEHENSTGTYCIPGYITRSGYAAYHTGFSGYPFYIYENGQTTDISTIIGPTPIYEPLIETPDNRPVVGGKIKIDGKWVSAKISIPEMNARGESAAGSWIWRNGKWQDLGIPFSATGGISGLNDKGAICGVVWDIGGHCKPALLLPFEFISRDVESARTETISGQEVTSRPIPKVTLSVESAEALPDGKLSVRVTGSVRDPLSDVIENTSDRLQSIIFTASGSEIGRIDDLPIRSPGSGVLPWQPWLLEVAFDETFEIDAQAGQEIILKAQTSANAAGNVGWAQVPVILNWGLSGFAPIDLNGSHGGANIAFSSVLDGQVADSAAAYFGDRAPSAGDGVVSESPSSPSSLQFSGTVLLDGQLRPCQLTISQVSSFSPDTIDAFEGVLTYTDAAGSPQILATWWYETTANSLRFAPDLHGSSESHQLPPVGNVAVGPVTANTPGWFSPFLWRTEVSRAIGESADFQIKLNGIGQTLRPFTYSPEKFYVVGQVENRPQLFAVTADGGLPAGLTPGNFQIVDGSGELEFEVKLGGDFQPNVSVTIFQDDFGPGGPAGQAPSGPLTREVVLTYFKLLYGDYGLTTLGWFLEGDNSFEMTDVRSLTHWNYYEIDRPNNGKIRIRIDPDIPSPVDAAHLLWQCLLRALPMDPFESVIREKSMEGTSLAGLAISTNLAQELHAQIGAQALELGANAANIYLAGLSIVNEGADYAITINELSEGNYAAAIGFLPLVPAGAALIIKSPAGHSIAEFADNSAGVIWKTLEGPSRLAKMQGFNSLLRSGEITVEQMRAVVRGGAIPLLKPGSCRAALRQNLRQFAGEPPAWMRHLDPQAHHDLPVKHQQWFLEHGMDINAGEYGRWAPARQHEVWHADGFNADWAAFRNAEDELPSPYTVQEIETFLGDMRNRYPVVEP